MDLTPVTVGETVSDGVGVYVAERDLDEDSDRMAGSTHESEGDGDWVYDAENDSDRVALNVDDGEADGEADTDVVTVGVTEMVGVTDGDGDGASAVVGGSVASTAIAICTLPARTATTFTLDTGT